MKWEIELNQTGIGTVKCDGVDIASDLVGCHMTATPGKGVTLFLELRTGAKFTLDNPTVQYGHQEQLDVMDTDPNAHPLDQSVTIAEEAEFNAHNMPNLTGIQRHPDAEIYHPDSETVHNADQNRA